MRVTVVALFAGIVATVPIGTVLAQTVSYQTAAGVFEIKPKGNDNNCRALLAGKLVRSFACKAAHTPKILAHYPLAVGRFSDVVVIQEQPSGSGCNGGPLHILAVEKDGAHSLTAPIEFCGGKDPVVEKKGGKLLLTLPMGPVNSAPDNSPVAVWEYSDGVLVRAR